MMVVEQVIRKTRKLWSCDHKMLQTAISKVGCRAPGMGPGGGEGNLSELWNQVVKVPRGRGQAVVTSN